MLTQWILGWLHFLSNADYLPSYNAWLVAASSGGAVWAVAYAVVDAAEGSPAHWYDLHSRWLSMLRQLFQPSGVREFLRAACAAVPLNVCNHGLGVRWLPCR